MFRLLSGSVQPAEVNTFETIAQWLERIPSDHNNNQLDCCEPGSEEAGPGLPDLPDLVEELSQMEEVLAELEMTTVLGHCNITPANILYNAFDQSFKFTGENCPALSQSEPLYPRPGQVSVTRDQSGSPWSWPSSSSVSTTSTSWTSSSSLAVTACPAVGSR